MSLQQHKEQINADLNRASNAQELQKVMIESGIRVATEVYQEAATLEN